MYKGLSSRPDAPTMLGVSLLALGAVALISYAFRITDVFVAATCGAAPPRSYAAIDAYITFLDCQGATEHRYWSVIAALTGCAAGYGARAWLRREARQDAKRDEQLDEEIARIRADRRHIDRLNSELKSGGEGA